MTFRRTLALVALTFALLGPMTPDGYAQSPTGAGQTTPPAGDPHAEHAQPPQAPVESRPSELPAFIPRLTVADRQAAFPDVEGHTVHDRAVHFFTLVDQLEWQSKAGASGVNLDSKGWIGGDRNRIWWRAEADAEDGALSEAQAHGLYARQVSRWWDIVAGVRQDFRPGPARTWAAVGIQGLAPYWFEVEATAYVGASGRTHARLEAEYELLVTSRLILQPLVEAELYGKSDPQRGIGAGLSATEAGLRVRYEFRRELAPYLGVAWSTKWGKTADFARVAGEETGGARLVTGLRLWF